MSVRSRKASKIPTVRLRPSTAGGMSPTAAERTCSSTAQKKVCPWDRWPRWPITKLRYERRHKPEPEPRCGIERQQHHRRRRQPQHLLAPAGRARSGAYLRLLRSVRRGHRAVASRRLLLGGQHGGSATSPAKSSSSRNAMAADASSTRGSRWSAASCSISRIIILCEQRRLWRKSGRYLQCQKTSNCGPLARAGSRSQRI